jgi:hypothetical protein
MAQLVDGFTDSLDNILSADPIEPELDSKGEPKAINWKFNLENAKSGGGVAEAEVSGWRYVVEVLKCRVTATKVKEVPKTPEELVKSSLTVQKENTQTPGFMDKSVAAVAAKPRQATATEEKEAEQYNKAKHK